ncbi:MAG: hypothetical protein KDA37_11500 [Planctomycetales bacterium]|nr:hypothetical protein [Planctomycetales bacterium]
MRKGDWVVYRMQKHSTSPGRRAKEVSAAPRGETYSYVVDKFWVVKELLADDLVLLVTRKGKQHTLPQADPNLRAASWWVRWVYGDRFREIEKLVEE